MVNKGEFLHELRLKLSALPAEDVDRTVNYYSEIIDDMTEDGKTEEEAIAELESVDEIAQRIISETQGGLRQQSPAKAAKPKKPKSGKIILILLICLFPLWIGLFIAAWAVNLSFYAAGAGVALAGVAVILVSFFVIPDAGLIKGLFMLGCGFFCAGFGVLWFIGNIYFTKALVRFIRFICRKIKASF